METFGQSHGSATEHKTLQIQTNSFSKCSHETEWEKCDLSDFDRDMVGSGRAADLRWDFDKQQSPELAQK